MFPSIFTYLLAVRTIPHFAR